MSEYTFFWSGPFSNWASSTFTYKGITFSCSEQAMMWEKAMLFGDDDTAKKILQTTSPREQKALGRKVKGYDENKWSKVREQKVFDICKEKFTQDQYMKEELLATGNTILVEASPVDKIWGIGLAESDSRAKNQSSWQGLNLLGKVLTNVREQIKKETT